MNPTPAPRTGRRVPLAGALVLLLLVGVVATAWWYVGHDRLEAGEVVDEAYVGSPEPTVVQLPWGRLEIAVADPVTKSYLGARGPLGGSLVGVSTRYVVDLDADYRPGLQQTLPAPTVELRTPGGRYLLPLGRPPAPDTPEPFVLTEGPVVPTSRYYVAVEGRLDLDDASVVVSLEGVDQTVDLGTGEVDAGAAAGLYDDAVRMRPLACPRATWDAGSPGSRVARCDVEVARTPYLTDVGWAPVGSSWLVVSVDTPDGARILTGPSDLDVEAATARPRQTVRLDGAEAVVSYPRWIDETGAVLHGFAVPDGAGGRLRISQDFDARFIGDRTATWTIDLPPAG